MAHDENRLFVEYEKKDKLFVGGKVSERAGANKLSSNFKTPT